MTKQQKQAAWHRGYAAEEACAVYLQAQGYTLLAHRYQSPYGEIDLIAQHHDLVAFIEVKARDSYAQGLESISRRQQRRIAQAAQWYMAENTHLENATWRFDCLVAVPGEPPYHLTNAWIPDFDC